MRNQTLKSAAAILSALGDKQLTKDELQKRLKERGIELNKDPLNNLLLDLQELLWIEKRADDGRYRVGIMIAQYWRNCVAAEQREAERIIDRLRNLATEDTEDKG